MHRRLSTILLISIIILFSSYLINPFLNINIVFANGITRVNGIYSKSAYSSFLAFTLNFTPTNGNLLILTASVYSDAGLNSTLTKITETNIIWTYQISYNHHVYVACDCDSEIWSGIISSSASTAINITLSTTGVISCDLCEYSGLSVTNFLDRTAATYGVSATQTTGTTLNTTLATELWVGCTGSFSGLSETTPANGFILLDGIVNIYDGSRYSANSFLEKIVSSMDNASSGTSTTSAVYWTGCIATFKIIPSTWHDITFNYMFHTKQYSDITFNYQLHTEQYSDIPSNFMLHTQQFSNIIFNFMLHVGEYHNIFSNFMLQTLGIWHNIAFEILFYGNATLFTGGLLDENFILLILLLILCIVLCMKRIPIIGIIFGFITFFLCVTILVKDTDIPTNPEISILIALIGIITILLNVLKFREQK